MLRNSFLTDEYQRVGFISGFEWQRETAIEYESFMQYWYGPAEHQASVFRILHRQIQISRDFPEHKCIQIFRFVCNIIILALIILIILSSVAYSTDKDTVQVIITCVVFLATVVVRSSSKLVYFCAARTLKKKIIKAIDQTNLYLAKFGYKAKFPIIRLKFLFCIPLWTTVDISRIDIFYVHAKRVIHGNFFGEIEMINQEITTRISP